MNRGTEIIHDVRSYEQMLCWFFKNLSESEA
jgi:hypothetical protein